RPCTDVFKRLLLLCSHLRSPFEDRTEFPEFFRSEFPEPAVIADDLDRNVDRPVAAIAVAAARAELGRASP
ncbi:MAG: hypothetical protein ABSA52_22015, partial [Candidatus Binatia bacterium]